MAFHGAISLIPYQNLNQRTPHKEAFKGLDKEEGSKQHHHFQLNMLRLQSAFTIQIETGWNFNNQVSVNKRQRVSYRTGL